MGQSSFKIALVQWLSPPRREDNLAKGLLACRKSKEMGADLVLFPEMWQVGYQADRIEMGSAIPPDDPFLKKFQRTAKELEIGVAITYLGKGSRGPTNSLSLFDPSGRELFRYDKVHTCSFDAPENRLEPGSAFQVATFPLGDGSLKIGAMICFDREFPESARTLALQGAEIIIVPNACLLKEDPMLADVRLQQLKARAFENMVGIALANYPKPKEDGCSSAFDVDGHPLVIANGDEAIVLADFDLGRIRRWQREEVWGGKYRRPECYIQ